VALCGTSGSGKTTFLNLIAGILLPDEGRIELDTFQQISLPKPIRRFFYLVLNFKVKNQF
jgi:ABC-type Fe3+/spermidine/putrescine transport system ATPase subunit